MPTEPRLLQVVPFVTPTATVSVTASSFTSLVMGGILLPSVDLLAQAGLGGRVGILLRFLAWIAAPATAQTCQARLVAERDDARLEPLDAASVQIAAVGSTAAPLTKRVSPFLDITTLLRAVPLLGLRVQGRVTGGTGTIASPTIALYRITQS